jgi:hypothetical protein
MRRWGLAAALLALGTSCSRTVYEAHFARPTEIAKIAESASRAPFIKCHMADGRVYVLEHWSIEEGTGLVEGRGIEYAANRARLGPPHDITLHLADIALIETNRPYDVDVATGSVVGMAIGTGASLALTVVCLTVSKACFGSCPTFFADDGHGQSLQAEGFSSSVARSLEATDVDAMWTAKPKSRDFDVTMTNDALETHAVASVRVLAAPRPAGGRVLRAGDRYFQTTGFEAPRAARGDERDVTDLLSASDGREYKSPASATDLAERETLEATFPRPAPGERLGLLVVDRNSLLNTFLFYQAIAFMGSRYGDWMATLEREGKAAFASPGALLGDIEVSVRDASGAFVHAGTVGEVGPIAREAELVVLPRSIADGDVTVHLTMAKGNWRIDQLALVAVGAEVTPAALEPVSVTRRGAPDARALDALLDPKKHLVTHPGDAYTMRFRLPPGDQELFLESRGYYYEWMRDEWLKEEDQLAALQLVMNPRAALKRLAPKFKAIEPDMDRVFWQSRVTRW